MSTTREPALRPLQAEREAVIALRIGGADPEVERSAFVRVAGALEATLRRLLRDEPSVPLELRLRALAADEMAVDEVVSALRQRDLISIELAAAYHELQGVQRKVLAGSGPTGRDVELVLGVVEQVEREAASSFAPQPAARPPTPPGEAALADPGAAFEPPVTASRSAVRNGYGASWRWAAATLALLALVALGLWWSAARRGPTLDEGIALFRTGDFDRAAAHFERAAEARPNDPTPRLYLARIYRRTGRFDQAQQELRQALETAPEDPALHRELGFLLLDVGRPDAAVPRFRTAVELDAESTEGWIGLIRALRESGQPGMADRLLARAPTEVRALLQPPVTPSQ